jgi:tyrosine-specific transport protein
MCLVAGTSIGAGMMALPMTLAKLGIIPSAILMLGIWVVMYMSSLVSLELNLKAQEGLPLGALARKFGGPKAEAIGLISIKGLCYALLAAYIYGGGSTILALLKPIVAFDLTANTAMLFFSFLLTSVLLFSITSVDYINRILLIKKIGVMALLFVALIAKVDFFKLPTETGNTWSLTTWSACIPVVFTSFGFQVIFHTITDYCEKDKLILKKVFFWGSLIPAIIYILWTVSVVGVISLHKPEAYAAMLYTGIDVGELVTHLSQILDIKILQVLVWVASSFSMVTSAIGVGIGLIGSWKKTSSKIGSKPHLFTVLITLIPPTLCAMIIPSAFIKALGVAGMILVVIALFMPIYLFFKAGCHQNKSTLAYPILANKSIMGMLFLAGIIVIAMEVYNFMSH